MSSLWHLPGSVSSIEDGSSPTLSHRSVHRIYVLHGS